jgi:hypothetical protein
MKVITRSLLILALAGVPAALAQKWEFGGGVGGGFYTSHDISGPAGSAAGKFSSNVAASGWLANSSDKAWGGELRYDYQRGEAQLSSSGTTATFAAQTHAVHYDVQLHFAPREATVRPFIAFGGGFKLYQGTGTEVVSQPLSKIGLLTKTTDIKPLVGAGAGLKVSVSRSIGLRAEVHDYFTPFPDKVIAPALGAKAGGWIQDIVVSFGLSILF